MNELVQESSTHTAVAPVPHPTAVPSGDPLPAWDWRAWLVAIPVALIVAYAFSPILANGFVLWDDDKNFLTNPYFRGLGADQVLWAWTTTWLGAYQPLAWMLLETQYIFCQLDPRGYHLASLLLHVADAVVLYVLTVALLVRRGSDSSLEAPWTRFVSAGLATALFAVHPLRVEAVAWASCQPYLPCALFSMLSVLAYLHGFPANSPPRRGWLSGSFFLFVAALLFKAVAVSLPAVLLILDVYPLQRFPEKTGRWFGSSARRALLEKIPFVMMSLIFMGLAIAAKPGSRLSVRHHDASVNIARACYAIWFYIAKTVSPLDLIAVYPSPRELNWLALPYSLCILATLAASAGLFLLRRRWPGLLAVWLCYLVIVAPNLGFIRFNDEFAADRYTYMAMLGSVIMAAAGFCWLWRMASRWRAGAIGIIAMGLGALLSLTTMTRNQCRTWLDSETLWTHALAHGANFSPLAHSNLCAVLCTQGKYKAAEAQITEALRLDPDDSGAHINLGLIRLREGQYEEAVAHFALSIRLNPGHADAHNNLGLVLFAQGKYEEAEAHLVLALRLDPDCDKAHNNLGKILSRLGKYEAAELHYAEAVRLNPEFADAHNNLGLALQTRGSYQAAEGQFRETLRLDPSFANAHYNLGICLVVRGRSDAAEAHFAEALRLDPGFADAHYNLGVVFFSLGNYGAARAHFADAVRLKPGDPDAYSAIAMLMAGCPEAKVRDGKGAVHFATRACELTHWKNPSCLNTLAAAQAEAGDFAAAVKSQQRAIELLTDERQKADYRSRLMLYQAKRPYRQELRPHGPTVASP